MDEKLGVQIEITDKKTIESLLGFRITQEGITFTAKGDAKQAHDRGLLLGKSIMYEAIEKHLLWKGLLTEEVKETMEAVKSELLGG